MRSLRRGIEFDGQAPIVKGAPVGVAAADPAVGVDMTRAGADLELPREALWPASWHADRETIRMASADSRSAQRRAGVSIVDITPLYALPAASHRGSAAGLRPGYRRRLAVCHRHAASD